MSQFTSFLANPVDKLLIHFAFPFFALLIFNPILSGQVSFIYASRDENDSEGPKIRDDNLKVELVYDGEELEFATGMAFLGQDDILVIEKNTGEVKRIINGNILGDPLLDVNVANKVERGMLGIAVSNKDTIDKTYVFLYFTASPEEEDGPDDCDTKNYCSSGNPVGHRLYRYELNGDKLINRKILLDLPPNPGADHLGGVITIGPDKNIYLVTGDGNSCAYDSCKDGIEHTVINSKSSNIKNGNPPEGRGGILRITQDAEAIKNKDGTEIFDEKYPLNLYYAYGIRNSFGLDFDPITGNLWDTENGPGFGDEINLVKPGFNSGWIRAQGVWPITNFALLDPNPRERGYPDNRGISEDSDNDNLFDFNNKGKYSSPEFTWNIPVGVTSIKFLNSNKLGNEYENDIFVGDIKHGDLYHFDLIKQRTQLYLNEPLLSDRVANSPKELEQVTFAKGFGGITDIEVGPDGYLYILSPSGTIYRIVKN